MNNKKSFGLSLVVISILSIGFVGCGDDNSTDSKSVNTIVNDDVSIPTDVIVERGPVYGSLVTDSKGNVAIQKDGLNIYTFSDIPNYPITVSGGWIDVDNNGIRTSSDIELSIIMKSYSNVVTPITTYIANEDESTRTSMLDNLAESTGVSKEKLLELPSKSSVDSILVNNAVFKEIIINNDIDSIKLDDIKSDVDEYATLNTLFTGLNEEEIASMMEQIVVTDLVKLNKLEYIEEADTTNQAPIANAGIDIVVFEGNEVSLNANLSNDDGYISSYVWTENDIILSSESSFSKNDFTVGEHIITLTVTDNQGVSTTDTLIVRVDGLTTAPLANAGVDQVINYGESITLSGVNSVDSDGVIEKYEWSENASIVSTNLAFSTSTLSVGVHILTLTVTDNDNLTATDTVNITVSENLTYSWKEGAWSSCTGECGTDNALQFRSVTCEDSMSNTVVDSFCVDTKPSTSQSCTESECTTNAADDFEYGTITSARTGKVWMDRNLGASQVCTSSTDEACYGDYYQWGRESDGHEKANSSTTSIVADTIHPSNKKFITGSNQDWTNRDSDGSLRSTNWNICPNAFRVPTRDELTGEGIDDVDSAYDKLKIPLSGYRYYGNAKIYEKGSQSYLWSNSVNDTKSYTLYLDDRSAMNWTKLRSYGHAVRCIHE